MVSDDLAARIDACFPQTQCARCGYPRCRAYAEAVARGEADINRCPPGGEHTLAALAALLGRRAPPLDPTVGEPTARVRAVVDEPRCIGCRKCLDACPVDAIVGRRRRMHTVIAALCNGCALCLPPCPVDCIVLVPAQSTAPGPWAEYGEAEAREWRARTEARLRRLAARARAHPTRARDPVPRLADVPPPEAIRRELQAALERARRKRTRPLARGGTGE